MQVWEVRPGRDGWRLTEQDATEGLTFDDFTKAETRARWLAMRHEVKGWPAEIRILDADGGLVGAWRGERYTLTTPARFSQAA
jgi:hypothetical protein